MRFPGFIDICTAIPTGGWRRTTTQALRSGYSTLISAAPQEESLCLSREDLRNSYTEPEKDASCDYAKLPLITPENVHTIEEWAEEVPGAFLDMNAMSGIGSFSQMNMLSRLFNRWPEEKPICVRGNENQIGSAVFMAQVHNKKVHVNNVTSRPVIEMIHEVKETGTQVTCDVTPLALVLSNSQPQAALILRQPGSEEDRRALWDHIQDIDCFSTYGVLRGPGADQDPFSAILPILLTMLKSEMLTAEDIVRKCCLNGAKLFGIKPNLSNYVEVNENNTGMRGPLVKQVSFHGRILNPEEGFPLTAQTQGTRILV